MSWEWAPHLRPSAARTGQAQALAQPTDPPGTALLYQNSRDLLTILKIVLNGSIVKQGDVVCELNSAGLEYELVDQNVTTLNAKRQSRTAQIAREIAEINVVEFEEGSFRIQLARAELAIAKAQDDLRGPKRQQTLPAATRKNGPVSLGPRGSRSISRKPAARSCGTTPESSGTKSCAWSSRVPASTSRSIRQPGIRR